MTAVIAQEAEQRQSFRPIAHRGSAVDRRAICRAEILGIPAFGEYSLCEDCRKLERLRYWQEYLDSPEPALTAPTDASFGSRGARLRELFSN